MNLNTLQKPIGLRMFLPIYRLFRWIFPGKCKEPEDLTITPYASAMLSRGNWMYRFIFPRFFAKMRYELPRDVDLKKYAVDGTFIYVGLQIRELEYNYFGHLFKELDLPRSIYANGFSLRRWMVMSDMCASVRIQFETMAKYGGIPHPAKSGELAEMIAAGKCVLFSLARTELQEESLLFSESHQLLLSAIHAQQRSNKPVYLIPLNFMWDRRPKKARRSIIDILFGEKENPTGLRKIVLFWRNYKKRALVQIGAPIDLKTLITEPGDVSDEKLASRIRSLIMDGIHAERRTVTGPPARAQHWFVERVILDPSLEKKLSNIAVERGMTMEQLIALARKYVKEIAANINYSLMEIADRFMTWVFKNLYENISVNTVNLTQIRDLSSFTPIIFAPNHRSHVDYLLISYLLYHNNMIIPHIAAGINLSFWPIGPIYRRLGAFFIRRTFHGNPVYRAVMQTYLSVLLKEGYNQEFFIEGGRSRTGKLRPPKLGMLSMYADTVIEETMKDLIFVPISITYEKVIEHKAYTTELEGQAKKPEGAKDILGLAKFLRRQKERNGEIYVRFGSPLSFSGAAYELGIPHPMPKERKAEVVRMLANQICHEINKRVVVTPLSLAAMALLLKPSRATTLKDFDKRVKAYLEYLSYRDVELTVTLKNHATAAIKDALSHLTSTKVVKYYDDPDFPLYEVMEDKRIAIDYYKNTVVHFLASLAFLCTILKRVELPAKFSLNKITEELVLLQMLFQFEFRFSREQPAEDRVQHLLTFLKQKDVLKIDDDGNIQLNEDAKDILDIYADLVKNVIDAYKGALIVLRRSADKPTEEKQLIKQMMDACPKLFLMGLLTHREAVTKENFSHAIAAFEELGAISFKEDKGKPKIRLIQVDVTRTKILQEQLEKVT